MPAIFAETAIGRDLNVNRFEPAADQAMHEMTRDLLLCIAALKVATRCLDRVNQGMTYVPQPALVPGREHLAQRLKLLRDRLAIGKRHIAAQALALANVGEN